MRHKLPSESSVNYTQNSFNRRLRRCKFIYLFVFVGLIRTIRGFARSESRLPGKAEYGVACVVPTFGIFGASE